MEFIVSYGFKTFNNRIGAGVYTVQADSIGDLQDMLFEHILGQLEEEDKRYMKSFNIDIDPK